MKRFAIYATICLLVGIVGAIILSMISSRQFESSKSRLIAVTPENTPVPTVATETEEAEPESQPDTVKRPTNNNSNGVACKINPDCDLITEYCSKVRCGDVSGVCKTRPTSCANDFLVVCSCDGKTYSNECTALKNGANVKGPGAC